MTDRSALLDIDRRLAALEQQCAEIMAAVIENRDTRAKNMLEIYGIFAQLRDVAVARYAMIQQAVERIDATLAPKGAL